MNASQFAWWLHGYDEINGQKPDARQWQIIMDHLAIVDEVKHLFQPPTPHASITITWSYNLPNKNNNIYALSGHVPNDWLQRGTITYC
jgi:hypothetical protein